MAVSGGERGMACQMECRLVSQFPSRCPRRGGCRRLGWKGRLHSCSPGSGNRRCAQEFSVTFQVVVMEAIDLPSTVDLPIIPRGPAFSPSTGWLGS